MPKKVRVPVAETIQNGCLERATATRAVCIPISGRGRRQIWPAGAYWRYFLSLAGGRHAPAWSDTISARIIRCLSPSMRQRPESGRIAFKVINHLGDEVMKVFRV